MCCDLLHLEATVRIVLSGYYCHHQSVVLMGEKYKSKRVK